MNETREFKIKAQAIGNRLLIQRATVEDAIKESQRMFLTDEMKNKTLAEGIVISKGEKVEIAVEVGDWVIFEEYAPKEIPTLKDSRLCIIYDEDVYVVMQEPK